MYQEPCQKLQALYQGMQESKEMVEDLRLVYRVRHRVLMAICSSLHQTMHLV